MAAWEVWVPGLANSLPWGSEEQVVRLKLWLLNGFSSIEVRKQDRHFLWVHLPLLQPFRLTWGVPACSGETAFPVSICSEELTNGFPWVPTFTGDFPFHSLAYASNNISHLSDTFSPLSSKPFNKQTVTIIVLWILMEKLRITGSKLPQLGVKVSSQTVRPARSLVQDQRGHPTPKGRCLWPLKRSSNRGSPGEGYQHLLLEPTSEPS